MAGAPPPPERSPRHGEHSRAFIPNNVIAGRHASPAKCTGNKRAAAALAGPTRAKRPRDGRGQAQQASSISSGEVRLQPPYSRESAGTNPARESTAGAALGLTAELWRLREKGQEEHLLWPGLQRHDIVLPSWEQWVPGQHRRPPRSSSAAFEPAATPATHAHPEGIAMDPFRRPPPRQHPPSSELRDGTPLLSDAMRRAAEEGARLLYAARNRRHGVAQQPSEAPSGDPAQWALETALGPSSGLANQS